ncbi:MAG: hypothetical protein ACI9MR_004185 [Myxococcota bacterium]|jgi:hypothetical protein
MQELNVSKSNAWKKRVAGIGTLIVGVGFALTVSAAAPTGPASHENHEKPATAEAFAITTTTDAVDSAGTPGAITVTIKAVGDHKFNTEYPTKLTFDAAPDGLTLPKSKLTKADGTLADKKTFAFTSAVSGKTPGEYQVKGTVKFSVCNDKVCLLKKEPVIAKVTVK